MKRPTDQEIESNREELRKFHDRMSEKEREWQSRATLSREELIALCAAHIYAQSFASKLGRGTSSGTWNAIEAAASIVGGSITYDEMKAWEASAKIKKEQREGK